MDYRQKERQRVTWLISDGMIFNGDPGKGTFRKKMYSFVLQNPLNNIYQPFQQPICDYMEENDISWWSGKLTGHTLSSQISCLNHLFPIRNDKNAVLAMVQGICQDIVEVLNVGSDGDNPVYIEFEAVSETDHLGEGASARGRYCTSVDALIIGKTSAGKSILFPIEWKYAESYGSVNKAAGNSGKVRMCRYNGLIAQSTQLDAENQIIYYYEPFYQLMRQTLWAEQMISHKASEKLQADDYIHVQVVPAENGELRDKLYPVSGMDLESTWRSCIKDNSKFELTSPHELWQPLISVANSSLVSYLRERYW